MFCFDGYIIEGCNLIFFYSILYIFMIFNGIWEKFDIVNFKVFKFF